MGGFEYFFDPNRRIFWLYIISSTIIATIWLFFNQKNKKIIFSKALWLHPSARLDYIYFIVSFFIKSFLLIPIIISAKVIAFFVAKNLINTFGFYGHLSLNYNLILILFTTTIFVVSDFTRYWTHRFLHTFSFLWEVHKIHHSAKVLTPFTFYRIHPIENLLFGLRYSLSIGFVTGIFIYFFGAKISLVEIYGVNMYVFLFSLLGSNLRHSHIALSYPKWCEKWLISPKQHQMHHSANFIHKNFGGCFAIWDRAFGTIAYSSNVKNLKFGLKSKSEMKLYNSIFKILILPFLPIKRKIQ